MGQTGEADRKNKIAEWKGKESDKKHGRSNSLKYNILPPDSCEETENKRESS
jgi:hypothetical protein